MRFVDLLGVTAKPKKLTPKQRAFVDAYLSNGFNATQAAIAAGYSEKNARQIASSNLSKVDIREEIEQHLRDLGATRERVMAELVKQAFGLDMANYERYLQGKLTLKELRLAGHDTRFIKKVKKFKGKAEIELVSSQWALGQLIRILRLDAEDEDKADNAIPMVTLGPDAEPADLEAKS